jgi:hypothetical protein
MEGKLFVGMVVLAMTVLVFTFSNVSSQSQPEHYVVKLYSGANMVATWNALDWGYADGQTLVFTVGEQSHPTRVRINGTFSVEEVEQ